MEHAILNCSKLVIDRMVAALDSIKGQIELSPSYQARAAGQKMLT